MSLKDPCVQGLIPVVELVGDGKSCSGVIAFEAFPLEGLGRDLGVDKVHWLCCLFCCGLNFMCASVMCLLSSRKQMELSGVELENSKL